jgi:hypothetical protein
VASNPGSIQLADDPPGSLLHPLRMPASDQRSSRPVSNHKERRHCRKLKLHRLLLISRLGMPYSADQFGQASWIGVADGDRFEIIRAEVHDMKSRAFYHQLIHLRRAGFLPEKDGDTMLADAVEQLGNGSVAQVGEVGAIKRSVTRQILWQIETNAARSAEASSAL